MQQVADDVERHNKGLGRLADGMVNMGQKMSLGITAPLAALSAVAFKSSADFEKTMAQVGIAADAAGGEVDELTKLAEKMGAETVFSAQDAADAMLALAKGGLTVAQIKAGALQSTLTLAAAGGIELGAAADYMANGLNMFGLDASKAGDVSAALAGAANASTASIESMGLALSQVGPGAKLAGLSLQETTAALAAFDNAGIKGSDAGTSLKTMLLGLVPQTDAAKEAMQDLGLKFTDNNGKFDSLATIAQKLKDKLGGLSAEQQQVALKTMFGTDAFRAAAILMQEGEAGIKKYTEATSDLGAAQKLADANMKGSAGAIERAKGAWETFVKVIGDIVAPVFVTILEFLTKLGEKFQSLSPGMQTAIVIVGALIAALGPLLLLFGMMANAIIGISMAMTVLNLSLGPILLIIAAIAALVALAIVVYKNWDSISGFFVSMWETIKGAFNTAVEWIKTHWDLLLTFMLGPVGFFVTQVIKHWDQIVAAMQAAVNAVKGFFVGAWQMIYNAAASVWNGITSGFAWAWDRVVGIWSAATGFFSGIWHGIVNSVSSIGGGIANAFSNAFESAKNIARGAVNWMIDKINGVISSVNNSAGRLPGVPNIPNIARLANGAINFAGGLARVGELGPELIALPQGANVYSNTKTRAMDLAGIAHGGVTNIINIDGPISSPHVADQYATQIGDGIIRRLGMNVRI